MSDVKIRVVIDGQEAETTVQAINQEIAELTERAAGLDSASDEFAALSAKAEQLRSALESAIVVTVDASEAEATVDRVDQGLTDLSGRTAEVTIDATTDAPEVIDSVGRSIDELEASGASVTVDVNADSASLEVLKDEIASVPDATVEVGVQVDSASVDALRSDLADVPDATVNVGVVVDSTSLDAVREDVASLPDATVNVDVQADSGSLDALRTDLDALPDPVVSVSVEADPTELVAVSDALDNVDGRTADATVDVTADPGPVQEVQASLDAIDGESAVASVSVDSGDSVPELNAVESGLADVDGKTAEAKVVVDVPDPSALDDVKDKLKELTLEQRIDLVIESSNAAASIGDIRSAVKQLEGIALEAGDANQAAFDKATQAAGRLKDRVEDVRDGVKTFTAGDPLEGLSKGFGSLKNKLLDLDFKGFSEEVGRLKTLAGQVSFSDLGKSVSETGKSFVSLGKVLLTNPIFLLASVIGLVVTNLDTLKDAIDGVSDADAKTLDAANKRVDASKEQVELLDAQEQSLIAQGKTEEEIADIKKEALRTQLIAQQEALAESERQAAAQEKAAQRNKEILKGILEFIELPILAVTKAIDAAASFLGQDLKLTEKLEKSLGPVFDVIDQANTAAADFVFGGAEATEESRKNLDEQRKAILETTNAIDGIDNESKKKAVERSKEFAKARLDAEKDYQSEVEKLRQDELTRTLSQQEQAEQSVRDSYAKRVEEVRSAFEKLASLSPPGTRIELQAKEAEALVQLEKNLQDDLLKIRQDAALKADVTSTGNDVLEAQAEQARLLATAVGEERLRVQRETDAAILQEQLANLTARAQAELAVEGKTDEEKRAITLKYESDVFALEEANRQKGLEADRAALDEATSDVLAAREELLSGRAAATGILGLGSNLSALQRSIDEEVALVQKARDENLISEEEYQKKLLTIAEDSLQARKDLAAQAIETTVNQASQVIEITTSLANTQSEAEKVQIDADRTALENKYEEDKARVEATIKDETKKNQALKALQEDFASANRKLDKQSLELQKQQIRRDRNVAVAQVILSTAIGIAGAIKQADKSNPVTFALTLAAGLAAVVTTIAKANQALKAADTAASAIGAGGGASAPEASASIGAGAAAAGGGQANPAVPTFGAGGINDANGNPVVNPQPTINAVVSVIDINAAQKRVSVAETNSTIG